MTDVRDAPDAPHDDADDRPEPAGDFIWYELMTPDAEGAKAFYDAVVGWNIGKRSRRVPQRLSDDRPERRQVRRRRAAAQRRDAAARRPADLARLYPRRRRRPQRSPAIEQAGGKTLHGRRSTFPNVGRVAMVADPQGAPFYVMKPIPPASDPNAQSDVFSPDQPAARAAGTSCRPPTRTRRGRFYGDQFGWTSDDFMPMGEMGEYRFIEQDGVTIGAIMRKPPQRPAAALALLFPASPTSIARPRKPPKPAADKILMGPMEVPGGECIAHRHRPAGRRVRARRPRSK